MSATLNDIAKLTGVDAGSVSRILRNHPRAQGLRVETREKVLAAAKKLGYRRNELAATIRTGENRTIAVIGRFHENSFSDDFNILASGVLKEATKLDYGTKIYTDDNIPAFLDEILRHQIRLVLSISVDPLKRAEIAALCRQHGMRLVFAYETSVDEFPTVSSAEKDGVRDAVLRLVSLGHKRIAFACGPHRFVYVNERHAGYLDGMAVAGLPVKNDFIACGEGVEERRIAIEKMLDLPDVERPTAFVCIADSLAMMVQRAALDRKLRLPRDLSVIGFGNNDLTRCAVYPISSVDQPFVQIGETAFKILAGEKCGYEPDSQNRYLLPTRLIERDSMAPPPREKNTTKRGINEKKRP